MQSREQVLLAVALAATSKRLIASDEPWCESRLYEYWVASKCRLDRWTTTLRRWSESKTPRSAWAEYRPTFEELLASEVLTRVWAAIAVGRDERRGRDDAEPIARMTLHGQIELKNRILARLVAEPRTRESPAAAINRLRIRCERWTDLLVGGMLSEVEASQFACRPDRAKGFADTLRHEEMTFGRRNAWVPALESIENQAGKELTAASPNEELNARIASAILGCFSESELQATHLIAFAWRLRMHDLTREAESLVESLISGGE